MQNNNIKPEKITKPIQLLAVWLSGLILLVSVLLTGAGTINSPDWLPVLLSISAVSIIPIVLILVFLLQTKYRPEMQEDIYYSGYLDKLTQVKIIPSKELVNDLESKFLLLNNQMIELTEVTKKDLLKIEQQLEKPQSESFNKAYIKGLIENIDKNLIKSDLSRLQVAINCSLAEYRLISDELIKKGVVIKDSFGKEIPSVKLMTVGRFVTPSIILNLIPILSPFGINFINRTTFSPHDNTIVIGSYAYKKHLYIQIDETLIEKIRTLESLDFLPNVEV